MPYSGSVSAADTDSPWQTGQHLLRDIAEINTPPGALAFWHLGQSGFVVKGGSELLCFDLFLQPSDERLRRSWEPPLAGADLHGVHLAFCSHDHLDHLDPAAVTGLATGSPGARFVVPAAAAQRLRDLGVEAGRVLPAAVDEVVQLDGVAVRAVPAAHGDRADPIAEYIWEPDAVSGHRFVGFVVEINGVRLYHAGDTIVFPGLVERLAALQVDVALLPINGRDWFRERRGIIGNMDAREAADLGHAIGCDVIVPMHYDMFAANPGQPGAFVEYCAAEYPGQAVHVPARCKRWVYLK